jgi:hypothetical protein
MGNKKVVSKQNANDKDLDDRNYEDEEIEYDLSADHNAGAENGNYDESVDEKRIRLAKVILGKANQLKIKRRERDGEDEYMASEGSDDGGIFMKKDVDDGDQEITKILQDKILAKRKMLYNPLFAKIHASFLEKGNSFECVGTLKGHTNCITATVFDPLREYLYSVSKDGSILKCKIFFIFNK